MYKKYYIEIKSLEKQELEMYLSKFYIFFEDHRMGQFLKNEYATCRFILFALSHNYEDFCNSSTFGISRISKSSSCWPNAFP